MTLINIIYFIIDGVSKRIFLISCVFFTIYMISKRLPKLGEKCASTTWSTICVFRVLCLVFVVQYTLPFILGIVFFQDPESFISSNHSWRDGLAAIVSSVAIICIVWHIIYKRKQPFSILGFEPQPIVFVMLWSFRAFFITAILGLVILKLSVSTMPILPERSLFKVLSLLFFAPFAEEVLIRGFVYQNFRKRVGVFIGILLSSICFIAIHQVWGRAVFIFFSGIFLCWLYEKSKSLIPSITGHSTINFLGVLISYKSGIIISSMSWVTLPILIFTAFISEYFLNIFLSRRITGSDLNIRN